DRAPVRGIKRQDHRLAAVVTQRGGLIRRTVQREVGRLSPGRERTRGRGIRIGHGKLLSQRLRASDSSGTIGSSRRSALRKTAIVVRAPIRSVTSKRCRSSIPETVCPSKPTTMSPVLPPARAAGLSGSTPVTSTPLFVSVPSARCASRSKGTFCPATPIRPRRILPWRMSWPVTTFAVLMPTAKQIPWAGRITAVLTPTTRPRASTSGPPELPGFSAASVWITSSISRPPTVAERAAQRAHDARGDGTLEAERVADRDDQLPDPQRRRVTELGDGERDRRDPDDRQVGIGGVPHELRRDGPTVRERHLDPRGVMHHVAVRQDEPVGCEHEPRALARPLPLLAAPPPHLVAPFDAHNGGTDPLGRSGHCPRVRVEQLVLARCWRAGCGLGWDDRLVGNEHGCCIHGLDLLTRNDNAAGFPPRTRQGCRIFVPLWIL